MKWFNVFNVYQSLIWISVYGKVLNEGLSYNPLGISMCRLKCLDEEGCSSYKFSTPKLQCCLTRKCTDGARFTVFSVTKEDRDLTQHRQCPKETQKIKTRRKKNICVPFVMRRPQNPYGRILISNGARGLAQVDLNSLKIEQYHVKIDGSIVNMVFSFNLLYVINNEGQSFVVQLAHNWTRPRLRAKYVTAVDVDRKTRRIYLTLKEMKGNSICLYDYGTCGKITNVHHGIVNIGVDWKRQNIFVRDMNKIYGVKKRGEKFHVTKLNFGNGKCLEVDPDARYLFFEDGRNLKRFDIEHKKAMLIKQVPLHVEVLLHDSKTLYVIQRGFIVSYLDKDNYAEKRKVKVDANEIIPKACLMR